MTSLARLRLHVFKETRELLPAWAACLAVLVTPSIAGRWRGTEVLAYGLGTAGLGALAMGHEYLHRTMPILLVQPVSRQRLLATKFLVLAAMLVPICYVFVRVLHRDAIQEFGLDRGEAIAAFFLPVLGALFVAPWLTMLTRNPVAGAVFGVSILFGTIPLAELLKAMTGFGMDPVRLGLWGSFTLSAVAAAAGYRLFTRLEAIDGPGFSMGRPQWLRRRPSVESPPALTKSRPVWLLVSKELHLQRMTFLLGAVYPVSWVVAILLSRYVHDALEIFYIASLFLGVEAALISGSLASAEERHAGTLEWQLLMPVAASRQWLIKVAVVLSTTIVLGCVLPAFAVYLAPARVGLAPTAADFVGLNMISSLVVIAAVSLYVSSFSSSGLRALLVAVPAMTATAAILFYDEAGTLQGRDLGFSGSLLVAIGIFITLVYALANHRSADRRPACVLIQVAVVAGVLVGGIAVASVAGGFRP